MTYKQIFESLARSVHYAQAWIVSSSPRGGLQIVQPAQLNASWVKSYTREFHHHDAVSWRAILDEHAVRAGEAPGNSARESVLFGEFLHNLDLAHMAAAPLKGPVLEGYAGALCVLRRDGEKDFSDSELKQISEHARQIDRFNAESRAGRAAEDYSRYPWLHRPAARQFIFDDRTRPILGTPDDLDERVSEQMIRDARQRVGRAGTEEAFDRVSFADSNGILWVFNASARIGAPATGNGACTFYCMEPEYPDWQVVRAADFAADPELARLVPAMQFMEKEFSHGPTLTSIAKTVHLSPFHFHRRFTELLGVTPKHFLLACQIFQARKMLIAREKPLVEISRECGFAHQSHFTSRFKQATGLTPTRWRRTISGTLPASIAGKASGKKK